MSTFHGLEMAKRALSAQQGALYTTGNNISNVNTEGYSRQRVSFSTDMAYPPASRNRAEMPGQMGTGVKIGVVERIRNEYLDKQYRTENSRSGYWAAKSENYDRMEGIMNEPTDSGLSKTMKQFWQSLEELAVNPENAGARSVVKEHGRSVAETFNYLSEQLTNFEKDLAKEIGIKENKVNNLLDNVNEMNEQIEKIEAQGYLPNDLYDERDRLIDELSEMVNIKVEPNNGSSSSNRIAGAEGVVSIEIVDSKGNELDPPTFLIDKESNVNQLEIDLQGEGNTSVTVGGNNTNMIDGLSGEGSLRGLIDSYGGAEESKTNVPGMRAELDKMAYELAIAFNEQHKEGVEDGVDFFDMGDFDSYEGFAAAIAVTIDPSDINASGDKGSGSGDNALKLAGVFDDPLLGLSDDPDNEDAKKVSVNDFFDSLIGELGVDAQEAGRRLENSSVLRSQVEEQRMSVSAVSLDEEMSNMIKFQHAYNAAARSMTSIDELIDRVINNMGLVGR